MEIFKSKSCLELIQSIQKYEGKLGRKIKILNIGNIANNAYNNANILNQLGFDADVICYDYYHSMSYPEWEHIGLNVSSMDSKRPNFLGVDLNGYERPRWFAQGPLKKCIEYLIARNRGYHSNSDFLWQELSRHTLFPIYGLEHKNPFTFRQHAIHILNNFFTKKIQLTYGYLWVLLFSPNAKTIIQKKFLSVTGLGKYRLLLVDLTCLILVAPNKFIKIISPKKLSRKEKFKQNLIRDFKDKFPLRHDQLTMDDLQKFDSVALQWQSLVRMYDLVIAYATDPLIPMLVGGRPYIAYEHGTIRDIPFENSALGRITALSYSMANAVYMTNADSTLQASKLRCKNLIYGLHGFNFKKLFEHKEYALSAGIPRELKNIHKKIFFGPARQHWKYGFSTWLKGNDQIIYAVNYLSKLYPSSFIVIFVEWGAEVKDSKELIHNLGVDEYFKWVPPMPKKELIRYYLHADCILDQFVLPCLGSVTLDAIAIGSCPVITRLNDKFISEFYGQEIPLLNCSNAVEIASAMEVIMTKENKSKSIARACEDWFHKFHSQEKLIKTLLDAVFIGLNGRV
jgi:hypothetical protein